MDNLDLLVLRDLRDWRRAGQRALLVTVVRTWGSSPRPGGSIPAPAEGGRPGGGGEGRVQRGRPAAPRPRAWAGGAEGGCARRAGLRHLWRLGRRGASLRA